MNVEGPGLADAIRSVGRIPTTGDMRHNAYRRFAESPRWSYENLIHDIKGEPLDANPVTTLPRLVRDGKFFRLETGEEWQAVESSEFSLFKRNLDGEDIASILQQRAALGYNLFRIWILNQSVVGRRNNPNPADPPQDAGIHPNQYPDFYERLGTFVDLCASVGIYTEITVFTSTGSLMPEEPDQQRHLDQTVAVLRDRTNVLLELVNEFDQHDNACSSNLQKPTGVLSSHGSNGADQPPVRPTWDYELYHTNDQPEFQRKTGHNSMEWADQSGHPCVANENTRYPDRDSSVAHAFDAAAGAALLCAGSCFHSEGGKYGRLFTGVELECATAWAQGARSVPLEFRRGTYVPRTDLEGPNCIRAYERKLSDGRSWIVRIRP
jgi:hypothetical protein